MTTAPEKFDLVVVKELFGRSIREDDDVLVDEYLEGYTELYKFFHLLGSVFGFVSNDLKAKIEILEELRRKEADSFLSFKIMLNYEKDNNLLKKKEYVSGSRTLLRLHRGLDFIREFLDNIGKIQPEDKTCATCQNAYNKTLAQFHPWLVRKGATLAMHALPTRDVLLNKVCLDIDQAIIVLPSAIEIISLVYDRTEKLYTTYDLHDLP